METGLETWQVIALLGIFGALFAVGLVRGGSTTMQDEEENMGDEAGVNSDERKSDF